MARQGNNPKRRVEEPRGLTQERIDFLTQAATYVGSGHHKRYPLDYGFERTNPVPTKSLCDMSGPVYLNEARELFYKGIRARMISSHGEPFPKYIWSVDTNGIVYEAKSDPSTPGLYHGYPIESERPVREYILKEWKRRCP